MENSANSVINQRCESQTSELILKDANNRRKTLFESLGNYENQNDDTLGNLRDKGSLYNLITLFALDKMDASINQLNLIKPVRASTWCRTNQYLKSDGTCDWCPEGQVTNTFSTTNCDSEVSERSACYVIGDSNSVIKTMTNYFSDSSALSITGSSTYEYTKDASSEERWIGWKFLKAPTSNQWIRMSGWVKFQEEVTYNYYSTGFKILGQVYDSWIQSVQADTWTWVSVVSPVNTIDNYIKFTVYDVPNGNKFFASDLSLEVFDSEPQPRSQYDNSFCIKSCENNQVLKNGTCVSYTCSQSSSQSSCWSNELNSTLSKWESRCADGLDQHTHHCKDWHRDHWQPAEFLSMEDCCGCGGGLYNITEDSTCNSNNNICPDYFLRSPYDPSTCIKGRCDSQNRFRVNTQGSCTKCPDHEIVQDENLNVCFRPTDICDYYHYLTVEGVCEACVAGSYQDPQDDTRCITSQVTTACISNHDVQNRHGQYCSDARYDYNLKSWEQNCDPGDDDDDFQASRDCCGCGGGTNTQLATVSTLNHFKFDYKGIVFCGSQEWGHYCSCEVGNTIFYGDIDLYYYQLDTSQNFISYTAPKESTQCNNEFGNPLHGIWKECFCENDVRTSGINDKDQMTNVEYDESSGVFTFSELGGQINFMRHDWDESTSKDGIPSTDFTLSFDFKTQQPSTSLFGVQRFSNKEVIGNDRSIYLQNGELVIDIYNKESLNNKRYNYIVSNDATGRNFSDNEWHYLKFECKTNVNCRVYIDGIRGEDAPNFYSNFTNTNSLSFGWNIKSSIYFVGQMKDFFLQSNYYPLTQYTVSSDQLCPDYYYISPNDGSICVKRFCSNARTYLATNNNCEGCQSYMRQDPNDETSCSWYAGCPLYKYLKEDTNCWDCPVHQIANSSEYSNYQCVDCPSNTFHIKNDSNFLDVTGACEAIDVQTLCVSNNDWPDSHGQYCYGDKYDSNTYSNLSSQGHDQGYCPHNHNVNHDDLTVTDSQGLTCTEYKSNVTLCGLFDTESFKAATACSACGGGTPFASVDYCCACGGGTVTPCLDSIGNQGCSECPVGYIRNSNDLTQCIKKGCPLTQYLDAENNDACAQCPTYELQDPQNEFGCKRPTCGAREYITTTGNCYLCPNYQLLSQDGISCYPAECPNVRQYVATDGTCADCGDYEFAENPTSTACTRATCSVVQRLNTDLKDGSCVQCPNYEKQDSANDTNCVRGTCQAREKLGVDANCTACEDYQKVDPVVDDTTCFQLESCAWDEYLGVDGECKTCDPYKIQADDYRFCKDKECPAREKVLANSTCEACPNYEYTENRTSRDCIRGTCDAVSKLNETDITGGTCIQCPQYEKQDLLDDFQCIRGTCSVRQKLETDANCTACEDYYTVDTSIDDTICFRPVCAYNENLTSEGICQTCPDYYWQAPNNDLACEPKTCGPREKVISNGTCQACNDYDKQNPNDDKNCLRGSCTSREKLKSDSSCEACPDYYIQDNITPNDTACIRGTCATRQRLLIDGTSCVACPNYQITDPSDNSLCILKVCPSDQIIMPDATCQACQSDYAPDSYSQKICLHQNSSAPDSLTKYIPMNNEYVDFFPTTASTQISFRIPAFKADDIDDVHPVAYKLDSFEPSSYSFTLISIKRHEYLRDELELTFQSGEEELDDYFSKQFTLTISGADHETTVVDTISIVLCPRQDKLKINQMNTEPWIVNSVTYRYDFSQINSIAQETNPKCSMKSFQVQCQNGGQAPGTCNEYSYHPAKKFLGAEKSVQTGLKIQECKDICDQDPQCTGIQRIVNYTGYQVQPQYNFGDCLFYTEGLDTQNLFWYSQNIDAYVKESTVSSPNECSQCVLASKPIQDIIVDQNYCNSESQQICQAIQIVPPDLGVIYTFYIRVELQSSLTYSLGPISLNVSQCSETSVSYTTSQTLSSLTYIEKNNDGFLRVPWEEFDFTLIDYFCSDDPAVQFNRYYLNITNFDSQIYPDESNPNCVACSKTATCSYQDCLSTTVSAIHQNKLMSFRIHIVLGTTNSQIELLNQVAVFDIMPTGCQHFNLTNYLQGAKINLSYLPQNIDLHNLIGVEAECVKSLSVRTDFADKVTLSQSPVYCSNIGGTCQLPFGQTSPPRDVQYWLGVADSQGYLDLTLGYIKTNSTSELYQKCQGETGMFAVNKTAEFFYGMPILFENSTDWYLKHFQNLKCFYTLNDPSRHMTGLDVNATLTASYSIKGELEHINGTSITLPQTQLEVINVGCGSFIPITLNETLGLKSLVFHSRDENAIAVLEDYSNIINDCSYCSLQYAIKTQITDNLTFQNYSGSFLKMNSTFALEVSSIPQNSLSQKIFIEASFNETDLKPRCSNYKGYMPLDITMCDSSALEIEKTLKVSRYDLKYSYAQDKQVISFDSLFKFSSTFDTNFECTNVTYSIFANKYDLLFKVNNTVKTFEIDLTIFRGIQQDVQIPFTIYGKQNQTILVEQDSMLEVFGPTKNQPPHFSKTIDVIVVDANLDAIRDGTQSPIFEYKLPKLIDFEGDTPIIEMSDNSKSLKLEKINSFEYKLVCDMSVLTREKEGSYSIFFKLEDDKFPESQLQTNAFASIEIKITETNLVDSKQNQQEQVDESKTTIQQQQVIEDTKEIVQEKKESIAEKLPPPPKARAAALAVAQSIKADSLIGASTILGPKKPLGVELISEEDQNKLIQEWQEQIDIKPPDLEPPPVEMKVDDISRDGKVGLEFNQDMIIPDFIKNIGNNGRMLSSGLSSLDEVNMASIFDISFALKSDVDQSKIEFYILLFQWDKRNIKFQIFFEDPVFVSKGIFQDTVMIDIKKPELFVSEAKGETMSADKLSISKPMPTQVPQGVDAEQMEKDSEQQQNVIIGVVVAQVIAALTLKGAKQDLTSLILALQVIIALKFYDVSLPANFDSFSDKIQEIVDGEAIDPEYLIRIFNPSFSYARVLGLPQDALKGSILETWGIIFIVAILFILACLLALVSYILCKSKRDQIVKKVTEQKKKLIWSGLIESQTIEYILMLTTVLFQAKFLMSGQKTMMKQKIIEISLVAPQLLLFPILMFYVVHKNRHKIDSGDPEFEEKYGFLIKNINTKKNKFAKYYIPIMLSRRLLLTALPVIFFKKFYFQIQMQIFLSTLFIIYYSGIRPTSISMDQKLIEMNEVFIMVTNYHMICFSDFTDIEIQFALGNSLTNFVMLMMAINFLKMAFNVAIKLIDKITRKRMEHFLNKHLEEQALKRKERSEKRKNYKKRPRLEVKVLSDQEREQRMQRMMWQKRVFTGDSPQSNNEGDIDEGNNTDEEQKQEIKVKLQPRPMVNFKNKRKKRLSKLQMPELETIKEDLEETNRSGQSVRVEQVLRIKTKALVAQALQNQQVSNFEQNFQGDYNQDDSSPIQTPVKTVQKESNQQSLIDPESNRSGTQERLLSPLQENSLEEQQTIEKLQEQAKVFEENKDQTNQELSSEGNADELMSASDY